MKPVVLIPAYKPEPVLIEVVSTLSSSGFHIIIVNDGSPMHYQNIFDTLDQLKHVTIVQHEINFGKGQALKTGFQTYLQDFHQSGVGIVTADADGQHSVQDIIQIATSLMQNPKSLSLGIRQFDHKVPMRSRFGNQLTRWIFKLLIGQSLQDTQTGLRGIPDQFIPTLLQTQSQGYEFELDMLILAAKNHIPFLEHPIKTIYENNNQSSHFNPLIDSFKIYFVFVRFLGFSIISGLFDYIAFISVFWLTGQLFLSESAARLLSGCFNFSVNKSLVFKSHEPTLPQIAKYTLLCGANLICSYLIITGFVFIGINVALSKFITLIGLFIANFTIQNKLIFSRKASQPFSTVHDN